MHHRDGPSAAFHDHAFWSTTGRATSNDLEVPTKLDTTGRFYLGCRRAGLGGTELEGSEEPSESYVDGRDRAVGQEV